MSQFAEVKVERVPRIENYEGHNLTKMASFSATRLVGPVTTEYIPTPSINLPELEEVRPITVGILWMEPIMGYLMNGDLPSDKSEARRLKYKVAQYCLIEDTLYRRRFTLLYLKCLGDEQVEYVMSEIHEGICGNHYGA